MTGVPGGEVRRASLPGARTLVVHRISRSDLSGVEALYAALDDAARHRRFFSSFRPGHQFFERMAAVTDRGGAGLVAVLTDDQGTETTVGEAAYEMLPNGNGELAITVGAAWRGWLGPYLLDALVEEAADHGVPNLEADILATNGPMLSLVRSRGYALVPNEDWTVVRAVIGTATDRSPRWPRHRHGLRVLVEGASAHWHREAAARAGLEVLACPGPVARTTTCPALLGQPCPLAAGADAIVVGRPSGTPGYDDLVTAHAGLHEGIPVCVDLPTGHGTEVVALVQRLARAHEGDGATEGPPDP